MPRLATYRAIEIPAVLADRLKDAAYEQRMSQVKLLTKILEEALPRYERKP